jgi:hypothetical protein
LGYVAHSFGCHIEPGQFVALVAGNWIAPPGSDCSPDRRPSEAPVYEFPEEGSLKPARRFLTSALIRWFTS